MVIHLEARDEGVVLPVKAQPGARTSGLRGVRSGTLKVCVTQVAEKGKANKAIIALLSKELGLPKAQIVLASGSTSSDKKFWVREISLEQLDRRIQAALARARGV